MRSIYRITLLMGSLLEPEEMLLVTECSGSEATGKMESGLAAPLPTRTASPSAAAGSSSR